MTTKPDRRGPARRQREDLRRQLRADLIAAGIRPDDAATAADIAERALRERRDDLVRAADQLGVSVRRIARITGLSKTTVQRLAAGKVA